MKRRPKALLLNPAFRYHDAEASRQPGYLAKRMAGYAKAIAKPKPAANVTPIAKAATK